MIKHHKKIKIATEKIPKKFSATSSKKIKKWKDKLQLEQEVAKKETRLWGKKRWVVAVFLLFLLAILEIIKFVPTWHNFTPDNLPFLNEKKISIIKFISLGVALGVALEKLHSYLMKIKKKFYKNKNL